MGRRALSIRLAALLVLVGVIVSVWARELQQAARLKVPTISALSPEERRATLIALEAAWSARPSEVTAANARDEKDFINHTAFFVQKIHRREIALEADAFYRSAVADFFARYGTEDILDD